MVSKYIGETEKNLDRVFTAAEGANAVLLFDEADALFGKRSEVKDAHDRYANIEISYLLQKMEEHEGIAILTTNLADNVDRSFLRRIAVVVFFQFPDAPTRAAIWRRVWPDAAPLSADLDLCFLAENVKLSGSGIKNIARTAAFSAASQGVPIALAQVIRAAGDEYLKDGRVPRCLTRPERTHVMGEVAKDRLRLDGRRLPFGKQAAVIRAAGSSASVLETFQRFAGNQAVADLIRSADAPASTSTRDFVRPVGEDASELQRTESSAAERPQSQHAPLNGPERFLWPQVENSVAFIMRKLNETYLSDEDEQLVIQQLRYWASVPNPPGSKERDGSRYLEHIFKRLSMATKDVGIVADQLSSYYSILLNRFDRANEVRDLRDALAPAFRGDEGTAESSWGQFFWDDVKKGVIEQQIYGYFEGLADAAVGFGESIVILIRAAAGDPQAMRTFLEGLAALPEVVIQFWEKRHELLDEFLSAPPRKQARVIGRIIGEIEIFLLTRKAGQSAAGASTGSRSGRRNASSFWIRRNCSLFRPRPLEARTGASSDGSQGGDSRANKWRRKQGQEVSRKALEVESDSRRSTGGGNRNECDPDGETTTHENAGNAGLQRSSQGSRLRAGLH